MAQVVEHILGKDEVGSSSLPSSSKKAKSEDLAFFVLHGIIEYRTVGTATHSASLVKGGGLP